MADFTEGKFGLQLVGVIENEGCTKGQGFLGGACPCERESDYLASRSILREGRGCGAGNNLPHAGEAGPSKTQNEREPQCGVSL
jgi:hypothetical protein